MYKSIMEKFGDLFVEISDESHEYKTFDLKHSLITFLFFVML